MKGFIEITTEGDNLAHIVNIDKIEEVFKNIIFTENDRFGCKETYEEIKAKIEEAVK